MATQPQRQIVQVFEPHLQHAREVKARTGTTQAMPDDRLLLTLDDGRSYIIDAERFNPQPDGTYHLELKAADRQWSALGGEGSA